MTGMDDDQLRRRLSRLDPAPAGSPVDPVTSPRAAELRERAMQSTDTQSTDIPAPPDELAARRRPLLLVAAAAVLVALVGGGLFLGRGDPPLPEAEAPTTLALELPPSDASASCIMFDVQLLAGSPVALAATATAVDAEQVTLDVDRWYRGGDADVVTIARPDPNSSAALDGVDFRVGERYLVTAFEGTVNGCGFSGPATPELQRAFDEAFAG